MSAPFRSSVGSKTTGSPVLQGIDLAPPGLARTVGGGGSRAEGGRRSGRVDGGGGWDGWGGGVETDATMVNERTVTAGLRD